MSLPLRDLQFALYEVNDLAALVPRETADSVLEVAERLAATHFAPFAAKADVEEPRLEQGKVRLPPECAEALRAHAAGGFISMAFTEEQGGLGLPFLLSQACAGIFAAANVGFFSYPLLTQGAANLIARFGNDAQRRRWLAPMLDGRVFGTMCLSEPHAGSSLADVRTLATPIGEGRYRLTGRKMWISGGEHELGDNIVHLVLARTPQAPAGVKGISLFLVPRYRTDDGRANGITLIGLNHKMGWRGHVNTALAFGDESPCEGELVGTLHQGLAHMFLMMNEARVTVGLSAAALGYAGYRYALQYARDRRQGRAIGERDPTSPQVPLLRHADIRRMLLAQKAWVEGGLDLVLFCARLVDDQHRANEPESRERAALLLDLLTPVAKSWPAEYGLEANKFAIQVAGGAGYTRDLPLERWYRDNRLNHIHEGTYGIHGLDLLGRKVGSQQGRALSLWRASIERTLQSWSGSFSDSLAPSEDDLARLRAMVARIMGVTERLLAVAGQGQAERALANATLYLDAFGIVTVSWRWLEQARVAAQALTAGVAGERAFYRGKLAACRWYLRHELPRAGLNLDRLEAFEDTALQLAEDEF
ncbi:MAG: acyl-CoA dehydrogenase [Steroidobacteraceae bacterium]